VRKTYQDSKISRKL